MVTHVRTLLMACAVAAVGTVRGAQSQQATVQAQVSESTPEAPAGE